MVYFQKITDNSIFLEDSLTYNLKAGSTNNQNFEDSEQEEFSLSPEKNVAGLKIVFNSSFGLFQKSKVSYLVSAMSQIVLP